jgi:L-fuconate dehydratase
MADSDKIIAVDVIDIRVPTSDTLLGSDPFHTKPNYSAVYTKIITEDGFEGLSIVFTLGAGNDWIAYGVKDLSKLLIGKSFSKFTDNPGEIYKMFIDHHQIRWLADGVNRMAAGGLINGLWDLWAKKLNKPMWKLLVDLEPEQIINSIDWRYIKDAITPEEARNILVAGNKTRSESEKTLLHKGPKAYSTAGWLGLTDQQIIDTIDEMKKNGFDCFKMKVGQNIEEDKKRLKFIRSHIGEHAKLMLDANQIWGVDEAIAHMEELTEFNPIWIEEPTARDDVEGHLKIKNALKKYDIGVAAGEQVPSPVIFKQLLTTGAIDFCQIDATRLGGVNDVIAVILMAKKYNIPVCPHGGGIGLCNMIIHYALWDQITVAKTQKNQYVEYLDFLQDGVFKSKLKVKNGHYIAPESYGWGLEINKDFMNNHIYPTGSVWIERENSGNILFKG